MLDHLHIQNYRLFKDLKIDKLGQVNLIAGKNNTGKTALLEALWISENAWNDSVVSHVIFRRGDLNPNVDGGLVSLFKDRDRNRNISVKTMRNRNRNESDEATIIISMSSLKRYNNFTIKVYHNNVMELEDEIKFNVNSVFPLNLDCILVTFDVEISLAQSLWNSISLTSGEEDVIDILKVIVPNIFKVRLEDGNAKVLLQNGKTPIPLKNFGEGVNRLFTIALALVNSKDRVLLIDEFEVGLHHSVQEQLWEIIFKYAKEWNIQVFATTHSQDTVKAFSYISSKEEYKDMGQYMRLQPSRKTGEIEAVIYPQDSLENSLDLNLETR